MKKLWLQLKNYLLYTDISLPPIIHQLYQQVRWRATLGSLSGIVLAFLFCFSLVKSTLTEPMDRQLAIAPAIQPNIRERIHQTILALSEIQANNTEAGYGLVDQLRGRLSDYGDSILRPSNTRQNMSLKEQIAFRQHVLIQTKQLAKSCMALDEYVYSNRNTKIFKQYFYYPILRPILINNDKFIHTIDSINQDLAKIQLNYLQTKKINRSQIDILGIQLAQLQLQDSREDLSHPVLEETTVSTTSTNGHPSLKYETPARNLFFYSDSISLKKRIFTNALELQRSELFAQKEPFYINVLDSCQQEIEKLRWLDTCRVQRNKFWMNGIPNLSISRKGNSLLGLYQTQTKELNERMIVNRNKRIAIITIVAIIFFIPFILIGIGEYQMHLTLNAAPALAPEELEPLILQLLLLAYADKIRLLLLTPRKIKRFAGKVRLQHYLLGALSQQNILSERQFAFGQNEQILAFILLLLIEEDAQGSNTLNTNEDAFIAQLKASFQTACATGKFNAIVESRFELRNSSGWFKSSEQSEISTIISLSFTDSVGNDDKNNHQLLKQLYWMNVGLLV